jgi:3-oxoacid CoA-transferase subunit B
VSLTGWGTEEWAARVAKALDPAIYINLGVGIPAKMLPYLESPDRFFQCENGLVGMERVGDGVPYPDAVDANSAATGMRFGSAIADLDVSFGIIRGGHLDATVLGAHQVAANGDLANWSLPGDPFSGVGGAMDLAFGPYKVIVTMHHTTREGRSKLVESLSYPLTAPRTVSTVITEFAVIAVGESGFEVTDMAPGITREQLIEITDAPLAFSASLVA